MGSKKFKGTTRLIAVLDRSGSMAPLAVEVISGYNAWLEQQKALPGDCTLTTVLFDTQCDFWGRIDAPIADAQPLTDKTYFAGGMTALYDAVGNAVTEVGEVGKKDRALVLVVTDGQENSSREWTSAKVKALITELEAKGNWTFSYLSAAPTAWADSAATGTLHTNTAVFAATPKGTGQAWSIMSNSTESYRSSTDSQSRSFYDSPLTKKTKRTTPPPR